VAVSLSLSPIKTPSGTIVGVSKIARDLTEAKKTREALNRRIAVPFLFKVTAMEHSMAR
jgi:hypothetical protein